MHFTVNRSVMQKGLQKVVGVIPVKTTIPILENVLLELTDDKLKLTGTDLEICTATEITVNGQMDGACAIPAKSFNEILRELPDIPIDVELNDQGKVTIQTKNGYYKLTSQPREEFPRIEVEESEGQVDIPANILARMVDKTIFAVSTDELRTILMSVYFQFMEEEFRCVATDGHRLVKIINYEVKSPNFIKNVIVPTKALSLLLRNIDSLETPDKVNINVSIGENHIVFRFEDTFIYSKLVDGQYPKYENVIPIDNDKKLVVSKSDLMSAAKRVSIFSNSFTHQVKFMIEGNKMEISSEDVEFGGEGNEQIDVNFDGGSLEVAYNGVYILDLLKHIDTEEVVFKLKDSVSAAIIQPAVQAQNEELTMLIMPIRINEG